jgi:hypothetical protein
MLLGLVRVRPCDCDVLWSCSVPVVRTFLRDALRNTILNGHERDA